MPKKSHLWTSAEIYEVRRRGMLLFNNQWIEGSRERACGCGAAFLSFLLLELIQPPWRIRLLIKGGGLTHTLKRSKVNMQWNIGWTWYGEGVNGEIWEDGHARTIHVFCSCCYV